MEDFEAKQEYAEEAIDLACDGFENYAIEGEKGKRVYDDFNKMMQRGGDMMIETMGPQVAQEI